jgi:hemerythrin superfamily protein
MGKPTETASKAMGKVKEVKQELTGGKGIFACLARQHGEVGTLIRRVGMSTKDSAARTELVPRIREELLSHAKAEEKEVYSVFRTLPALADEMDHQEDEHAEIEEKLNECLALGVDHDDFFTKWHAFALAVEKHVIEEEQKIFPKAKKALDEAQSEALEEKFLEAQAEEKREIS